MVAICDLDEDMARDAAARFDIETVYTDYEKMLAREDIDVIDVCTAGGIGDKNNHEPLAFAAVQAGKHCLCEKPVAP